MSREPKRARAAAAVVALLSIALAHPVVAQAGDDPGEGDWGFGAFQVGYVRLDLDGLNGELQRAGLPRLDRTVLTLGGEGYGVRGRWLIGLQGQGILGRDETTPDGSRKVSLGGGYGFFRVGYLAVTRGGFNLYPSVGVGGGAMTLKIIERSAPTFEEVLADPARSSHLETSMFLLDAAVSLHYRVQIGEGEDGDVGGLVLGLQAGYTFSPGNPSWSLDGTNGVAGGPPVQIQGLYARASIGGWGREGDEDPD